MKVLFVILFLVSTELLQTVAVHQQEYNPYPFGTTIFCIIQHPLLLISCIYYLGWLWGILLFLAHLFNIVHATVSWVLGIPFIFVKSDNILLLYRTEINMLFPLLLANLAFTIISFFVADFKSLYYYLESNTVAICVISVIAIVLGILRAIIDHFIKKAFRSPLDTPGYVKYGK